MGSVSDPDNDSDSFHSGREHMHELLNTSGSDVENPTRSSRRRLRKSRRSTATNPDMQAKRLSLGAELQAAVKRRSFSRGPTRHSSVGGAAWRPVDLTPVAEPGETPNKGERSRESAPSSRVADLT